MKKVTIKNLEEQIANLDVPNNLSHLSQERIARKIIKMKKIRRNIIYVFGVVMVLGLICGFAYLYKQGHQYEGMVYNYHQNIVELSKANLYGNSRYNYMNHGVMTSYNQSFYVSCDDGIYEISPTLETKTKILEGEAQYLNIMNDKLYFINKDHHIQQYDLKLKKVTDLKITAKSLMVVGDYLFYITDNEFSYLVQYNTKTNEFSSVSKAGCHYFYIQNDWVYYVCDDGLYKVPLLTGETTKLVDKAMTKMCLYQNLIYYTTPKGQIYRIKQDGTDEMLLVSQSTNDMIVRDGYLYYTTLQGIYRLNLEDGTLKQLSTSKAKDIQIAGSWLFYRSIENNEGIFTSLDENETKQWLVSMIKQKGGNNG